MDKLENKYYILCNTRSDINEHLPVLYEYSKQCDSVIELGVRGVVSTYAFMRGLMHNNSSNKRLLINDITPCPIDEMLEIINELPINLQKNWISDLDMVVDQNYDMTFIDTYHIYGQLKRELDKYSKITNKYIIMHDTTIDGIRGELYRSGFNTDEELYAHSIKVSKETGFPISELLVGLMPAIDEFLNANTEWILEKKLTNNNGLTILRRINT